MWIPFKVEMKLAQPLAVGPGWRLGFVTLTRLDVPPRTFWGAFTDALTRWKMADGTNGPTIDQTNENPFRSVGTWVETNLRFLPGILVAKDGDDEKERFVPWYAFGEGEKLSVKNGGGWQPSPSAPIRKRYVFSHGSTALDYDRMKAEDAMLHETERIMPQIRGEGEKILQVWLETILFVKDSEVPGLKNWLSHHGKKYLRIGRDVAVGDGCFSDILPVEIDVDTIKDTRPLNNDQKVHWDLNQDKVGPIIQVTPIIIEKYSTGSVRLPGPFLLNANAEKNTPPELNGYWGELRPHLVREFDVEGKKGFGRKMGYPGEGTPKWILDHGGVLAVSPEKEYNFMLERDGWTFFNE